MKTHLLLSACLAALGTTLVAEPKAEAGGKKTVQHWLKQLKDADPLAREESLEILAREGDKKLLAEIEPLVKDPAPIVRVRACLLVMKWHGSAREDVLQIVRKTLEASKPPLTPQIYQVLFTNADETCLPLLRDAVFQKDPKVSVPATKALVRLGLSAGPVIVELLDHPDAQKQKAALTILRALGTGGRPLLAELNKRVDKLDRTVQGEARTILLQFSVPDENALPFLVDSLKSKSASQSLLAYAKLISRPLPKEVVASLVKMTREETEDARVLAAAILAEIAPEQEGLADALAAGLAKRSPLVARAALRGLLRLGPRPRPALPHLLLALETAEPAVKAGTVPVMAGMGRDAVAPIEKIIIKAIEKGKKNDYAAQALGRIGADAVPTILRLLELDEAPLDWHMALALKAMDKVPAEAVPNMLRMFRDKDYKARRLAVDCLVAFAPPTKEVDEALWKGLKDTDGIISRKCFTALRGRSMDAAKWVPALKEYLTRYWRDNTDIAALHFLWELDAKEAQAIMPWAMDIFWYRDQPTWRLIHWSTLAKHLKPSMPRIYELLASRHDRYRLNALTLLAHLPAHLVQPVQDKLLAALPQEKGLNKFMAAKALLRTDLTDRSAPARALAEVLSAGQLPPDVRHADIFELLGSLGKDARSAVPSLRTALNTTRFDLRALTLMAIVSADAGEKKDALALADRWFRDKSAADRIAGAAVLVHLDAAASAEALQSLERELGKAQPQLLELLGWLGSKAKTLIPQLQVLINDPQNPYPAQTVLALGKIDGNIKLALERLLRIAREEPLQAGRALIAIGSLGPLAQPAVAALVDLATREEHTHSPELWETLARLDPTALNRIATAPVL